MRAKLTHEPTTEFQSGPEAVYIFKKFPFFFFLNVYIFFHKESNWPILQLFKPLEDPSVYREKR